MVGVRPTHNHRLDINPAMRAYYWFFSCVFLLLITNERESVDRACLLNTSFTYKVYGGIPHGGIHDKDIQI